MYSRRIGLVGLAPFLAALTELSRLMPRGWRGYGWNAPKGYRRVNRLNRSSKWRSATSYTHARSLSPFPERPVR
jgi:hypothetical protein